MSPTLMKWRGYTAILKTETFRLIEPAAKEIYRRIQLSHKHLRRTRSAKLLGSVNSMARTEAGNYNNCDTIRYDTIEYNTMF